MSFGVVKTVSASSCTLVAGTYASFASTAGQWTGTGCTGGSYVPTAPDVITIPATSNTILHIANTESVTLGSNGSGVGAAITVQGTNSSTYATLIVDGGGTLTLRGFDLTSNFAMYIARFGRFTPQPGATILIDVASDGQTEIRNDGIITSIGTSGSPITYSIPSANYSWNTQVTSVAYSITGQPYYNYNQNVCGQALVKNEPAVDADIQQWISNSGGTGLGSFGNSSLSFSSVSPSNLLVTPVVGMSSLTSLGKYYVDHTLGIVYWYCDNSSTISFNATYKHLTYKSGYIRSNANTTYNQAVFQYSTFQMMGSVANGTAASGVFAAVTAMNKQSDALSGSTFRNFKVDNSTFRYAKRALSLSNVSGTSGDPILITNNNFDGYAGDKFYGNAIFINNGSVNNYVNVNNNIGSGLFTFLYSYADALNTGWNVSNNILQTGQFVKTTGEQYYTLGTFAWPDSVFDSNVVLGLGDTLSGNIFDGRTFAGLLGASGQPLFLTNNIILYPLRAINYLSYVRMNGNYIDGATHHVVNGPFSQNDTLVSDVTFNNNIVKNTVPGASSVFEMGYNTRQWHDLITVNHNTFDGNLGSAAFAFFDSYDGAGTNEVALGSKFNFNSNLITSNTLGITRANDSSSYMSRLHMSSGDYNDVFSNTTNFSVFPRFATFSTLTNVTGVALSTPSYSSGFSSKTLTFTYASSSSFSLTWDGGSAVQLVTTAGTATSAANPNVYSGTLTDSTQNWNTALNVGASSPIGQWVKITGGTGSGQVRRITSTTNTTLTVTPSWTTLPTSSSTYVIINPEVTLTASNSSTVRAGIDPRSLPASTVSDSVTMTLNAVSSDPTYTDTNRNITTWDSSLGGAGTFASGWSRLLANPSLSATLLTYFRNGYVPNNLALHNTAHDGTDIGAVAVSLVDTVSPTVSITSPAASAVLSGTTSIVATSTDAVGVAGVKFYYDSTNQIGVEDTTSPYSVNWDTTLASSTTHTLIAVSRDTSGNVATSSAISVTVNNSPPVISSVSAGTPSTSSITITWTTDKNSTSQVAYGPTASYTASSTLDSSLVTSHSVTINGLSASTGYHFRVVSTDSVNNTSYSSDRTFATGSGPSNWYNASWQYRKLITIDHTRVSGTSTLVNFPILFSTTDADLKIIASGGYVASSIGTDLVFTDSDGITRLDYEIEKYASTTGQVVAWVRVPTLATSTDTTLYVYFGNAAATDLSNKTGVWNSNFKGVWHLGGTSTIDMTDSVGVNNGSLGGGGVIATTTGQVGGGALFDGFSNITAGQVAGLSGATQLTLSGWIYRPLTSTSDVMFGGGTGPYRYLIDWQGTSVYLSFENGSYLFPSFSLSGTGWHYISITYNGSLSSANRLTAYLDGTVQAIASSDAAASLGAGANQPSFEIGFSGAVGRNGLNSKEDEIRVANVVRTAGWVVTEYNNQNLPGTFVSEGSLQSVSSPDVTAPTVGVTVPTAGATVIGSSVSLAATSTDNIGVVGVSFYLDSTNLINSEISATTSPNTYTTTWNSTGTSNGSHAITAVTRDFSGNYATSSSVSITVNNPADVTPPVLSNGAPTGALSAGTLSTTLSVTTDEVSTCKYGTTINTAYTSLPNTFSNSSSTSHSTLVSGLANGQTYNYYIRCQDGSGNRNTSDYTVSFTVSSPAQTGGGGGGGGGSPSIIGILNTTNAPAVAPKATSTPPVVTTSPAISPSVTSVETTLSVAAIQHILVDLGFLPPLTNYGTYGPLTIKAVKSFQRAQGIVSSGTPSTTGYGVVGPRTIAALTQQTVAGTSTTAPNTSSSAPISFTRNLQLNDTGTDVQQLQHYLNTHGFPVSTSGPGSLDHETTTFGPATYTAVKKFQASVGLPSTGYVGEKTRGVIN